MFALAVASGASLAAPTPAELASAMEIFTGRMVAADAVRQVSCEGIAEEPTEAVCEWQQKDGRHWRRYSGFLAVDGNAWLLIDAPAPVR